MKSAKTGNLVVDWGLVGLFALGSLAVEGGVKSSVRASEDGVAVVFAPWTSGAESISRAAMAGADIVRLGSYPFIIIVRPNLAGYRRRVADLGAWVTLDLKDDGGCLSERGSV